MERKLIKTENVPGYIGKHFPNMYDAGIIPMQGVFRELKEEIIISNDAELDRFGEIVFQIETKVSARTKVTETFRYNLKPHDSISFCGTLIGVEAIAEVLSQH